MKMKRITVLCALLITAITTAGACNYGRCNFNDQPCQSCEFCSEANPADWGMSRFSKAKMDAEKTLTNTTLSI